MIARALAGARIDAFHNRREFMSFFITLVENSDASRRAIETSPRVHAMMHKGLALPEYLAFLRDLYHIVWHFCPIMATAAARCGDALRNVRYELYERIDEEKAGAPRTYGLVRQIDTLNPVKIAFAEWVAMLRDVVSARSAKEVWGYLFGPPGWGPDGSRATTASIRAAAGIPEDSREAKARPAQSRQWQG